MDRWRQGLMIRDIVGVPSEIGFSIHSLLFYLFIFNTLNIFISYFELLELFLPISDSYIYRNDKTALGVHADEPSDPS